MVFNFTGQAGFTGLLGFIISQFPEETEKISSPSAKKR